MQGAGVYSPNLTVMSLLVWEALETLYWLPPQVFRKTLTEEYRVYLWKVSSVEGSNPEKLAQGDL